MKCPKYSTNSIPLCRNVNPCRVLATVAKVFLLSTTFALSWMIFIFMMKTLISSKVERAGVQDKIYFLNEGGKASHPLSSNNTKVSRLSLKIDAAIPPLRPTELNKERKESKNKTPPTKGAAKLDGSNDKHDNKSKGKDVSDKKEKKNIADGKKDTKNEGHKRPGHEKNEEKQKNDGNAALGDQKKGKDDKPDSKHKKDKRHLTTQKNNVSSSSSSTKDQQSRGKEGPSSTFIPVKPDTAPLGRPPDIPKKFVIEEADYCRKRPNLQIIAYVHSAISRVKQRMETRRSWANASAYDMGAMNVNIGVVFMVGRAKNKLEQKIIQEESEKYHDIVQGSYGDHYRLLTYKGLAGLYWIDKHCSHVPWTLHSDDDTHIDIFLYYQVLQQLRDESQQNFLCSLMYGSALRYGRYKVRYSEYPVKEYPLYCSGGVWFLRTKLIKRLFLAQKTVPFLWVDDAYITGLVARRAGIGQYQLGDFYGGAEVKPEMIGKMIAWFFKFAPRVEWWQKIVEYHKKHSMKKPATLALPTQESL